MSFWTGFFSPVIARRETPKQPRKRHCFGWVASSCSAVLAMTERHEGGSRTAPRWGSASSPNLLTVPSLRGLCSLCFYYPVNPAGCHPFINEGEVRRLCASPTSPSLMKGWMPKADGVVETCNAGATGGRVSPRAVWVGCVAAREDTRPPRPTAAGTPPLLSPYFSLTTNH